MMKRTKKPLMNPTSNRLACLNNRIKASERDREAFVNQNRTRAESKRLSLGSGAKQLKAHQVQTL
jgi:hypothetical protein